ncbi:MAG TPA: rhomboid family intramembrane serine protease [Gammaproteobacteria bacterium]|jgi:membrane associated rhomboid family serine protease
MIPIRDENPTHSAPVVTITLIAVNVLVFIWQLVLPPDGAEAAVYSLGLVPAVLFGSAELPADIRTVPALMTPITSMFLHGGFLHLAGNMLYLWVFGDNIEDRMGPGRFLLFYVLCGIAAAFAQALFDMDSRIPMIGASGAVSGVLGAYLLLYPRTPVLVAIPLFIVLYTFHVPAVIVLGIWFVGQLLSSLAQAGEAGVAFRAHVGGFVAGLLLIRLFARSSRPSRFY